MAPRQRQRCGCGCFAGSGCKSCPDMLHDKQVHSGELTATNRTKAQNAIHIQPWSPQQDKVKSGVVHANSKRQAPFRSKVRNGPADAAFEENISPTRPNEQASLPRLRHCCQISKEWLLCSNRRPGRPSSSACSMPWRRPWRSCRAPSNLVERALRNMQTMMLVHQLMEQSSD